MSSLLDQGIEAFEAKQYYSAIDLFTRFIEQQSGQFQIANGRMQV